MSSVAILGIIPAFRPDIPHIMPQDGVAGLPAVLVENRPGLGIIGHRLIQRIDLIVQVADIPVQAGSGVVDLLLRISLGRVRPDLPGRHAVQIAQRDPVIVNGTVVPLPVIVQLADELGRQIRLIKRGELHAQRVCPPGGIHGPVRIDAFIAVHQAGESQTDVDLGLARRVRKALGRPAGHDILQGIEVAVPMVVVLGMARRGAKQQEEGNKNESFHGSTNLAKPA